MSDADARQADSKMVVISARLLAHAIRADLRTMEREPGRRLPTVYLSPATLEALAWLEQSLSERT